MKNSQSPNYYKRFTKKEDVLILKHFAANPENLSETSRTLSNELNRNPTSIRQRWYYISKKKNSKVAFVLFGKSKNLVNRKISRISDKNSSVFLKSPFAFLKKLLFKL